ncbi:o-methyltransferas-like protein [Polyplosphaeria fusca]|uniref:O-methyltransferas-like protein n=1 Tax=Polyplosphaeria fusca TaxID=682080 RepID=A0A9P4V5F8_9PLEO|nr:o-methyltransferas-like protein [Polyplosphaeria fusca]
MSASSLAAQLVAFADASPAGFSDRERKALVAACEKVRAKLENPLEMLLRVMFGALESSALRLAVDMKFIDTALAKQGPVTAKELAEVVRADELLVVRIMRMLVPMGIFAAAGEDAYTVVPLAAAFSTDSPLRQGVVHVASQLPAIANLPEYLENSGYKNPSDAYDGPWQFSTKSKQHYFEWLAGRPRIQEAFNATMAISRMQRGQEWFEFYPVQERLLDKKSQVVMVDIGGGLGHDTVNFQKAFPGAEGKLVFTDLPAVIEAVKREQLPQEIEAVPHDFFRSLPSSLHGAKAYYLRTVLHDWPDKQALQILGNIKDSMAKDSVILINENAMPDEGVGLYQAELDLLMMGAFASLDRTVAQFGNLLDRAGFKLVQVWKPKDYAPGSGMLFEAVLKG